MTHPLAPIEALLDLVIRRRWSQVPAAGWAQLHIPAMKRDIHRHTLQPDPHS